jgi:hypothetical protein
MNRKTTKIIDFVILMGIILLIFTLLIFNTELRDKKAKCAANPFLYGAKQIDDSIKSSISCRCSMQNASYSDFKFNSTLMENIRQQDMSSNYWYFQNNFTKIIEWLNRSIRESP